MSDEMKNSNIVKLADRRKRGSAVHRRGATGRPPKESKPNKVWSFVQLAVFLALVAYFVRQC